jgi:nucleotide-binding universal stress UspA family protein
MTYKDILVYADATPACAARLDIGAMLATAHDAHLVALHVDTVPFMPADVLGTGVTAELIGWQVRMRKERTEMAQQSVKAAEQRQGVSFEWRKVEGLIHDALLDQGRYADLIVVSQDGDLTDLETPVEPRTGVIAISAGRPVLVVPRSYKGKTCGKRVLVAWKPSAEATRAVHDALPILQKAEAVTVMRVNPDRGEPAHNPGFDLATHLARHGVNVTVMPVAAPDQSAGDIIIRKAAELEADLIVMGAYGHSRLRELVFGGATRSLLQAPPVPVLMAR